MTTQTDRPYATKDGVYADPEALSAVSAHVQREYGLTGYRVGIVMSSGAVSMFEVRHGDGSSFNLVADRYGLVRRPVHETKSAAEQLMREMHKDAVTP